MTVDSRELELIDYLDVLWRWKWLIAAVTVVAIVTALLVGLSRPPSYTGATALMLSGEITKEAFNDPRVSPMLVGVSVVKSSDETVVRMEVTGHTEDAIRNHLAMAVQGVRSVVQNAIDAELEKIAELEQDTKELKALSAQLKEKRLKTLERNDAAALMSYQVWTDELVRIETRLHAIAPMIAAPRPELRESAITISEIPGVPLRLLLFVVLLGAIVASTLLAFFIDYVQTAVSARRAVRSSA
jgi:Chain length determinant protein